MGREKQYDREELLDRAIELFRRQGYNGTSTAKLVEALGVNRKSMYAEFGSKQELFLAALEQYDEKHLSRVLSPLEAPEAGADAIRDAFEGYARAAKGRFRGRGCLMCNTAVERAATDGQTSVVVEAYFARLNKAFRHALGNARKAGDIQSDNLTELAAFFTTSLIGVAACIRAEAAPKMVAAACKVATSSLR